VLVWRSRAVRQAQPFSHSDLSCVTRGRGVRARGMGSVPDSAAPGLGRASFCCLVAVWNIPARVQGYTGSWLGTDQVRKNGSPPGGGI
jgi:hypothetical protein